jgi:hypothetical protein
MKISVFYKVHSIESGLKEKEAPRETSNPSKEMDKLSDEVLSSISTKEFLAVKRESRLEQVTNPSIKSSDLQEGNLILHYTNKQLLGKYFLRE